MRTKHQHLIMLVLAILILCVEGFYFPLLSQWYQQTYFPHSPSGGAMAFFEIMLFIIAMGTLVMIIYQAIRASND